MSGRLPATGLLANGPSQSAVIRQVQSLKEVIPVCPIVEAAQHTAVLETDGRSCTGTDHFARAFPEALYSCSLRDGPV